MVLLGVVGIAEGKNVRVAVFEPRPVNSTASNVGRDGWLTTAHGAGKRADVLG